MRVTFAQLDALATAPTISAEEYERYLVHLVFRERGEHVSEGCTCNGDPEALLFCLAPIHFRPWWAP